MIPNFTIGAKTFSAYLICTLIGIFVAGIFAIKKVDQEDDLEYLTMLLFSAVGVFIGAHLLYALTNIRTILYLIRHGAGFLEIIQQFGGSVFYGGLLGGICAAKIYCVIAKVDIRKYVDVSAFFIPLFHVFGRIGCFLSGCCYGMECDIGFVYQYSAIEAANHVRRFPVQLVEAFGNLLIFYLIYTLWKKKVWKQQLLSLYFLLYGAMRFTLEFFRGDFYRGFFWKLSTSQLISIPLFLLGAIALLRYLYQHSKTSSLELPDQTE